jgi:hypothetical protein
VGDTGAATRPLPAFSELCREQAMPRVLLAGLHFCQTRCALPVRSPRRPGELVWRNSRSGTRAEKCTILQSTRQMPSSFSVHEIDSVGIKMLRCVRSASVEIHLSPQLLQTPLPQESLLEAPSTVYPIIDRRSAGKFCTETGAHLVNKVADTC